MWKRSEGHALQNLIKKRGNELKFLSLLDVNQIFLLLLALECIGLHIRMLWSLKRFGASCKDRMKLELTAFSFLTQI
jgi:hypothetical protein